MMSSREIAELCEKRHDHVLRDIEKMLQDIGDPKFGASSFEAEYTTPQNKQAKEYRLPKDLTVTLITGYRADLRYKVVKRLEEMERQPRLPDLSDPVLLVQLLTEHASKRIEAEQRAQVAEGQRLHLEANDAGDDPELLALAYAVQDHATALAMRLAQTPATTAADLLVKVAALIGNRYITYPAAAGAPVSPAAR